MIVIMGIVRFHCVCVFHTFDKAINILWVYIEIVKLKNETVVVIMQEIEKW